MLMTSRLHLVEQNSRRQQCIFGMVVLFTQPRWVFFFLSFCKYFLESCRPAVEVLKSPADRESSPADLHSFQHARVSQLVQHHVRIKLVGPLQKQQNTGTNQNICLFPSNDSSGFGNVETGSADTIYSRRTVTFCR